MVQVNFARKEVNCKIVYYGPGLSGKTTNIEVIYDKAPKENRGELTSIATEGDRTLFFDFMPLELGNVAGMNTKFQLYTVPGQVYYNSTRKLVLQGADGIVFVADSQVNKLEENLESLQNLEENLREYGMDIATMPIVLQYNKRDLPNVMSLELMNEKLNKWSHPYFEAIAFQGIGVFQTLKALAGTVLDSINKGDRRSSSGTSPRPASPPQPASNPQGYGAPPQGYGTPPQGYGTPPQG
ncbi:MAG: GTPase domain-containing protein, partial [Planctomycetota bacterium]